MSAPPRGETLLGGSGNPGDAWAPSVPHPPEPRAHRPQRSQPCKTPPQKRQDRTALRPSLLENSCHPHIPRRTRCRPPRVPCWICRSTTRTRTGFSSTSRVRGLHGGHARQIESLSFSISARAGCSCAGKSDRLTAVVIPAGILVVGTALVTKGLFHLVTGTGAWGVIGTRDCLNGGVRVQAAAGPGWSAVGADRCRAGLSLVRSAGKLE